MKLKMVLTVIIVAVIGLLAFGLYKANSLKKINIKKSVVVNVDKETAFNMVRYLENFPKWSPFLEQDPSQNYQVKGVDGEVGAQYHWEGNGGKDLGYQEIKIIKPNSYIKMMCDIQKPFVAKPTFEYSFEKVSNGTKINQDFNLQSGLVDSFFMWVFGAKKEMEMTNERGMELLKEALN
ncbi:SRPBCC family protein [Yeosuana marina]|uniref:hypothetical protein n=1 Tax=Yeosuana marina TaxID=1565536 RepID=UPI001F11685A|nr:hypothetical protein [Yeosuana marina]